MGRVEQMLRVCVIAAIAVGAIGCGSKSSGPTGPATITSVVVNGNAALTAVGQTTQLTAKATLSDGSTQDVTSSATWTSISTSVATVTSGGLVTGVNFGQTTITATVQGVKGTIDVTLQLNLTGTWKGSTADSTGVLQVNFVLVQVGSSLTGTGTFSGGAFGTGTFTGTVSTTSNTVTFNTGGSGAACTFSASGIGTVTGNTFSGTYTGSSCFGPLANGVIALTKQ